MTIAADNAFWCDFYHLTMAQSLFLDGEGDKDETFEMFVRKKPFGGAYIVAAGLGPVLSWLRGWGYDEDSVGYLRAQRANGVPVFHEPFLDMLGSASLELTIDAFPEGELIFPNEPFVRVTGPAWQCSVVESAFLNGINSASLIATKASRIMEASRGKGVMEFGLRRSNDRGGLLSTRSAAVGGFMVTSNVDAARKYGLKAAGTHAHSFVMHYDSELAAFEAWLIHNPNNATLLVDSYDALEGVTNAIKASKSTGVPLEGVRLDSGDLAYFSKAAREILDAAGFYETKIVVSGDLDEYIIADLLTVQKAPIDVFGVGTKLVVPETALGGVYKLKVTSGESRIKVSEDPAKTTIPGATEVIRLLSPCAERFVGDVIAEAGEAGKAGKEGKKLPSRGRLERDMESVNMKSGVLKTFGKGTAFYKPMTRVMSAGVLTGGHESRSLAEIAEAARKNLAALDSEHKRLLNPHLYVAGLERSLYDKRGKMIRALHHFSG
ncbi:MAG: nicotinate phosphoribosyltransferase [Synergistaceae bacterium]|nr:nicotinate phosphoribosyltransferase [Synergistaceae bacterium]